MLIGAGDMLFGRAADVRQQDLWAAEVLADVLSRLRFDLIAPGPTDLSHPLELAAFARRARGSWLGEALWNAVPEVTQSASSRSALVRSGDVSLGFVIADAADAERASSLTALQRDIAALREQAALVVALVRATRQEPVRAVAAETSVDVIVQIGAGAAAAPSSLASPSALLLAPGRHGESVLIADVWLGARRARAWQLASDGTIDHPNTRAVKVQLLKTDSQIQADPDTRSALDTLFARQNSYNQRHPDPPAPGVMRAESYVGSDTCAACHTRAYFWWQTTAHARAFDTLLKRGRQFDRDCIGCHVTGYDRPGGATLANIEHVAGVGCESCHGPGGDHADNPRAPSASVRRAAPAAICLGCHDAEHHAAFGYETARALLLTRDHGRP